MDQWNTEIVILQCKSSETTKPILTLQFLRSLKLWEYRYRRLYPLQFSVNLLQHIVDFALISLIHSFSACSYPLNIQTILFHSLILFLPTASYLFKKMAAGLLSQICASTHFININNNLIQLLKEELYQNLQII